MERNAAMATLLAHCLGATDPQTLTPEALVILLERVSVLSRAEARIVVMDYLGSTREDILYELQIAPETLKTYWKRIYRKVACRNRADLRMWMEQIIGQQFA
jgi:DNA-binding CsgD family transcriptional regulator